MLKLLVSEVCAVHVINLQFPEVYHMLVLSQSCDIDNDIDSIYDIYIVVNVPAKAQARRKLVLPPGLSILLHHRSPSDIRPSAVVHGHNLPHRPPQAVSVCINRYSYRVPEFATEIAIFQDDFSSNIDSFPAIGVI